MLTRCWTRRLDDRVRERILVEAAGNPLALLELPTCSASARRRGRPRRRACARSARGCGSGIRWCAQPPTGPRPSPSGATCTERSPTRPTTSGIPIGERGIAPRADEGLDEAVAGELERSAGRARGFGRGGCIPGAGDSGDA
jgi:hypothetical protein